MGNSLTKFLEREGTYTTFSVEQKRTDTICQIVEEAFYGGSLEYLLETVRKISKDSPNLSVTTIFQIAGDEAKVEETCQKNKYK